MSTTLKTHLDALQKALHTLKATGNDGFEGLMAEVLGSICEQPFRLASSGTQRGRDGSSAFDEGATYFEAKRYDSDVSKKDVLIKLSDLSADNAGQVDTWIMGATSEVPSLYEDDFRAAAERDGIGIVILDWTASSLPPLAVAVGMASPVAKAFLTTHLSDPVHATVLKDGLAAIDAVIADPEFGPVSRSLKTELKNPSVGLGLAKSTNRSWLEGIFASRIRANQKFGQPVAPNDAKAPPVQPRPNLIKELLPAFQGPPVEKTYVVLGLEGTGKTWLVATSWLAASPASLLVFIPATDLRDPDDIQDIEGLLIRKLIMQTDTILSEASTYRWQRRFAGWRANPNPPNVRLTVCIDGLNQHPRFPWSRWINAAALLLAELGGQLVVTTRIPHFPSFRDAIVQEPLRIQVPEWGKAELDAILKARGIDPDSLASSVFARLKNPRILDIALSLMDGNAIQTIGELSIGRLLFEHMRQSQKSGAATLSAPEFAKTLSELGAEVRQRVLAGTTDDLKQFDIRLDDRLAKVASSSFFRPVGSDPDRYEIADDGLHLALALSLVDELETEARQNRDPYARLEALLEPVAALDMTADVVASAIEISCLNDECPEAVASALIRHYAGLQNPPADRSEALEALVRKAPAAFVAALKELALSSPGTVSVWLTTAILEARDDPAVLAVVKKEAAEWLTYYSLSPERLMHTSPGRDPVERVQEERTRIEGEIRAKLESLTDSERAYLGTLIQKDGLDLDSLHREAFYLLAGIPLADIAPSLMAWTFTTALAPAFVAPRDEFSHLMHFNSVDWQETQAALISVLSKLPEPRSRVGNWTAVAVLRATGNVSDAIRARLLAEDLNRDRERFEGFSLVEEYCDTDPFDPDSVRASNIDATAERYRTLDVDQLRLLRGFTREDHFMDMAMPGIARFAPEAGVEMLRRFGANIPTRSGLGRRQGILTLLRYSVLLDRPTADALLQLPLESRAEHSTKDADTRDEWLISQYSLLTAMPHLTGNEQLDILERVRSGNILLDLTEELKTPDASLVESALTRAFAEQDEGKLTRLLGAAKHAGYPLTTGARTVVGELITSTDATIRSQVIGIIADIGDTVLLQQFVDSGWDASALNSDEHFFEKWYGSAALIAAVSAGLIELGEALNRMAISHYGFAAERLGEANMNAVTDRISLALGRVLDLPEISDVPEMERTSSTDVSARPPLVSILDEQTPKDMEAAFDRMGESDQQFQDRQDRLYEAYKRFNRELTAADAQLVLADLTFSGLAAIHRADPDVTLRWQQLLLNADDRKKSGLHLFAMQLASALAGSTPDAAAALIKAYVGVRPFIRHVMGAARLPAEIWSMWSNARVPEIRSICIEQLNEASTDADISLHVIAAFRAGHEAILADHASQLIASGEPAKIARAITIAGLSDTSDFADAILARFADAAGFIGSAYRSAIYSYERNRWARHWFVQMAGAVTPVDFWRYSVLFTKMVDSRFDLWSRDSRTDGPLFDTFYPTLRAEVRNQIKRWNDKRRGKLFGEKPPEWVFLSQRAA